MQSNIANKGKISLDWGNIFDILSIFNVKINVCEGEDKIKNIRNFQSLEKEIQQQVPIGLFVDIMGSQEYKDLYESNLYTFNKVGEAQKSTGLAKEVDEGNKMRFINKSKLQKRFFNTEVSEVKIGYGN